MNDSEVTVRDAEATMLRRSLTARRDALRQIADFLETGAPLFGRSRKKMLRHAKELRQEAHRADNDLRTQFYKVMGSPPLKT